MFENQIYQIKNKMSKAFKFLIIISIEINHFVFLRNKNIS